MISDTLVVLLIFVMPEMTEVKNGRQHKFRELFEQADKDFDIKYGIDIEELKKASSESVIEAEEKTKEEKKKALEQIKFEWP
jgi:hypothetical protein